jgi:Uma2 family endonuclease
MISYTEYLERERVAVEKSEYVDGEVYGMAGASIEHNLIGMNLGREISSALKDRPCLVLGSEMKVWMAAANTFAYPDLSGLCGRPEFHDERRDVYTNPAFIIEILSDSTETYDRGGKFHRYQTLPSLREYVLVSQHTIAVDVYRRHEAGWLYQSLQSLDDTLRLDSVDAAPPLAEIYRGVFG